MSIILRGIETADSLTLGIINSAKNLQSAKKDSDSLGVTQSALEIVKGSGDGASYATTGVRKALVLLPFNLDPSAIHFLQGPILNQVLGSLGVVTSVL